ncbi:DUF5791 family protein [Salinirubellus salinus]|uniref:DUF5791 family protein n=1 Tax=Salinirubellus salinus TaxID=1364945 RepID=A0A9E7R3Q1_9EURY|nr:DUF5791 family protein [Salinirubellus salinus]UWM54956.1 DUF5791 family protein [Salinirubellus salinus]
MFHEAVEDPGTHTPADLHAAYEAMLVESVESVGVERAAAESGVDEATVEALVDGESPELTLEEGAALLALDGAVSADDVVALSRDALLMGMTTAVVDVDSLSAGIDGELSGREIQAKVEGRFPITLREFARIHQFLDERSR